MLRVARLAGMLVVLAMPALVGCRAIASLGVLTAPRQIQKAEFELTSGRLAVVIDHARGGQADPVFDLNLHNRLVELFRENKVSAQVTPYDDVVRLRQANEDFASWSIQRVGRALHADQVLYIRVEELSLRPSATDPVITPQVALLIKVIGVDVPGDACASVARSRPGAGRAPRGPQPAAERGGGARRD